MFFPSKSYYIKNEDITVRKAFSLWTFLEDLNQARFCRKKLLKEEFLYKISTDFLLGPSFM